MSRFQGLDFLQGDPEPVAGEKGKKTRVLSPATVTALMDIDGVDGVWVDELAAEPHVVIYVTDREALGKIPSSVEGLPVSTELGEQIRAL